MLSAKESTERSWYQRQAMSKLRAGTHRLRGFKQRLLALCRAWYQPHCKLKYLHCTAQTGPETFIASCRSLCDQHVGAVAGPQRVVAVHVAAAHGAGAAAGMDRARQCKWCTMSARAAARDGKEASAAAVVLHSPARACSSIPRKHSLPAQPRSPLAAELRVHPGDGHKVAAAQIDAVVSIHGAHLQGSGSAWKSHGFINVVPTAELQ